MSIGCLNTGSAVHCAVLVHPLQMHSTVAKEDVEVEAAKEKRWREDHERDAGAETEVEVDGDGSAGRRRSRMEIDLEGIRDEEAEADEEEQAMDVEAPAGGPTLITHPVSASGSEEAMDVGDEERNERKVKLGS
ncbi:hypothetical protein BDZ89DRAFT_1116460 [Hymenopellis radicata]|nr:hypothetical protein BDZ89DRAFT_1116460 [Hymenopellis radicata]